MPPIDIYFHQILKINQCYKLFDEQLKVAYFYASSNHALKMKMAIQMLTVFDQTV